MTRNFQNPRRIGYRSGFTLVEIIVAITIVAILASVALPTLTGIERERAAREPVAELLRMGRTVRARAMAEQHPYQIALDHRGFHAARYFNPYGESQEFDELLRQIEAIEAQEEILEASRRRGIDLDAGREKTPADRDFEMAREGMKFHQSYELPDGIRYELLFWGETEWVDMQSGLFRRWVFQPSGMCQPLRIRVRSENAFFEVEFHPLTGDVKSERSWVE